MLVHIYTKKIDYKFELFDKVTIVSNESWIGENILIDMISDSHNEPKAVHDESDIQCGCFLKSWRIKLEDLLKVDRKNIIFIDDFDERFEYRDFLNRIKDSDNYFVLFSREIEDLHRPIRKMVVDESRTTDKKIYITLKKAW